MIYEQRTYTTLPGRMPKLQARFRDHTLRIWERLGIRTLGFWTTLVGPDSNELTYMIVWESLAEREVKYTAFQADPEWLAVRAETEKDGPINARIANMFLTPTDFSALQ
jgi:hypothetical protein